MKSVIFIHVLYIILIESFMAQGVTKCESKIELRAVLLSCPVKDSGCDDDDPLSQAMKAEEAQILQDNSKNFESMREEKERGFPNAIKECKRKLIITLKVKNSGRIPCDDEYIVVDHVFDPITGGKGRLLSPLVLKLRQEQMIQLYKLQFQRVVNSDPFEEHKETEKLCSVNPDNPTCGIAMYDGKPIPFSEGFCCSCDPFVNAKRQLSPLAHEDSFLYRDSKLISQENSHFTRQKKSSSAIVNPELIRVKPTKDAISSKNSNEDSRVDKEGEKEDDCSTKELSLEKIPNFLLEQDRKIICNKGDFLSELCKLQNEKNKGELETSYGSINSINKNNVDYQKKLIFGVNTDYINKNKRIGESDSKYVVNMLQDCTTEITMDFRKNNPSYSPVTNNLNDDLMCKNSVGAVNTDHIRRADSLVRKKFSDAFSKVKTSQFIRRKRENREKPYFSRSEENLGKDNNLKKFDRSKNVISNHRKRLFELSHKRPKKVEIRCRDTKEFKTGMPSNFPEEDYVKAPPPKYFFSHDKYIIDPQESSEAILNSTCRSTDQIDLENSENAQQSYQFFKPLADGRRTNVKVDKDEKPSYDNFFQSYQKLQKKDKFQNVNLVGKINNNNEGVTYNTGGKIDNNLCGGKIKIQNDKSSYRERNSLRNDKRFKIEIQGSEKGGKEYEDISKNVLNEEILNKGGDNSVNDNIKSPKSQKSRFNANNVKNVILKSENDKKSSKSKIRNFLIAKTWERQKLRSDLSENDKKDVSDNEILEKEKEFKEPVEGPAKEDVNEPEIEKDKLNENNLGDRKEKESELSSKIFDNGNDYKQSDKSVEVLPKILHSSNNILKYNLGRKPQFNKEPLEYNGFKGEIEPSRENKYVKAKKENYKETNKNVYPLRSFSRGKPDRIAFNIEVIRKQYPETSLDHYASLHFPEDRQFLGQHITTSQDRLKDDFYYMTNELKKGTPYVENRQNPMLYYKPPQKHYSLKNEENKNSEDGHFLQNGFESQKILKNHPYYPSEALKEVGRANFNYEPARIRNRLPQKYETFRYRKPVKHYYPPLASYNIEDKKSNFQRPKQNMLFNHEDENKGHNFQSLSQSYPAIFLQKPENFPSDVKGYPYEETSERVEDLNYEKIRVKRTVGYSFEPAKGFFRSEVGSIENEDNQKSKDNKIVHELKTCPAKKLRVSQNAQEEWTNKITGWQFPQMKHDNLSSGADIIAGLYQLQNKFKYPLFTYDKILEVSKVKEKEINDQTEQNVKLTSDKQRLIRSYMNAPNYVLEEVEADLKVKRQLNGQNKVDLSRGNHKCEKESFDGEYSQDTAHCMRFGDLWYSVYLIKKPIIAQIVEIQLFDKHSLCDGTTQWRDLTKGKMIRIGTFLPKAEDELPTISMTFMGEKSKKVESAINPDNYLLLIPSHLSDPSKASFYPQVDGGPEEYLVVKSKDISSGGDCNMIGTSFEAFARQPDRCAQPRGSCLKRQPVDLWREDMEARIKGKKGKYFVENFGTVPNSPVKTLTNFTGEYLALEYYGEYTSTIEIEVKADYNAVIRKGSNAQIPAVYIDSTYPKKTRIILSVLNIGLTSAYFRPRLGDCPPDLDPVWCPLEGPLVIIPPQQRHDFKLDLSGVLPPYKIHVTVQVLNQLNRKIAYRKILIKKGERCLCAFHCRCSCIGNLMEGRTCRRLSLQEYRGAGYVGSFPFRGGSTSASESILSNIIIIFCTAGYLLLLMGVLKAVLGIFFRRLGISGTRVIVGPRKLCTYYEYDLRCCSVLFDEYGFPIHPTTCLPVQIVPIWLEFIINVTFFFLYPLRGMWFLILSFPCCKAFCADCDGCCRHDDNGEDDHKCSRPLLEKNFQSSCVNYNLTTINTKKSKAVDYLHYLPYRDDDDDPLEEEDTEFVLQEMKRYRKK